MRKEVFTVGILFLLAAETVSERVSANQTKINTTALGKKLEDLDFNTVMKSLMDYEDLLENTDIDHSELLYSEDKNLIAYLYEPDETSGNLTFSGSDDMAGSDSSLVSNKTVTVFVPEDLTAAINRTPVVFCLMKSRKHFGNFIHNLHIGLSISGRKVINLPTPVKISVEVGKLENVNLTCVFYDWNSTEYSNTGCKTYWDEENGQVNCYCDHLTYFAVLMVSSQVSTQDAIIQNYITLIGCSLSLLCLAVIVLLYVIKWRAQADHSQQIHVSLVVALLLLNLHHLMIDYAVNVYTGCVYVAVLVHYSLMATFTWTAIEGFHLYLLFLRVFNIYIRRYLLKLSLVGWGVPAVVVVLIFIIDKTVYLNVPLSNNQTKFCYINSDVVKYCTTLGYFSVIFVFNLTMLVVVVRKVYLQQPVLPDTNRKRKAKNTCTVLGLTCLLGISWSLSLFSFGKLSTVGSYLFCVFNTLLGFFIFIWFCIYKCTLSGSQTNADTASITANSVN